jgi:lysophospholipase L1-like esterase
MRTILPILAIAVAVCQCAAPRATALAKEGTPSKPQPGAGMVWHDPTSAPFSLEGFPFYEQNRNYCRLPMEIMPTLREKLQWVVWQPSGGVIRFMTDATRLALNVTLGRGEHSRQGTIVQESGFDVYVGSGTSRQFRASLAPHVVCTTYVDEIKLPGDTLKEVAIYFPLLNPVHEVLVGLAPDAVVNAPPPHARGAICFYGSSITQGFACSRPGLTYPAQICRALDAELINLGFGGNARGDSAVADAIASLSLDAFVLDYDHNSGPAELEANHEPFFKRIRAVQPTLPIVMASSPNIWNDTAFFGRRYATVEQTYRNALDAGDSAVYLVPGHEFWPRESYTEYSVDRTHPNDLGFKAMADRILRELKIALE